VDQTIRENLFVNPSIPNRAAGGWISPAAERRDALGLMRRFGVRAQSPELMVAALSGGNQQKVVLARWLSANRRLLVLEEPTAGVDVGAKAEIYHLLLESLGQGCAVLLVSSDFEEVCGIASRALVFYRGRIVTELSASELSMARLVRAATGDRMPAEASHG
jgi:ribose transport system ATP-binding protein